MSSGVVAIGIYVLFAGLGSTAAWLVGLAVEARSTQAISLVVFLTLAFGALILAWPLAARLTEKLVGEDPVPDGRGAKRPL